MSATKMKLGNISPGRLRCEHAAIERMKQAFVISLAVAMALQCAPVGAQPVEEIHIARSLRMSRGAPTDLCAIARTGFKADYEDSYEFRTPTITRGRITDAMGPRIGSGRGCLGLAANAAVTNFYLHLQLGSVALRGRGDCRRSRIDFPQTGLTTHHCYVELSDPSGRYSGGLLTTNTMSSRNVLGAASDPSGYTQPSIATIRLWKKPNPATKE